MRKNPQKFQLDIIVISCLKFEKKIAGKNLGKIKNLSVKVKLLQCIRLNVFENL